METNKGVELCTPELCAIEKENPVDNEDCGYVLKLEPEFGAEKEKLKGTRALGKPLLTSACCVTLLSFSLDEPTDNNYFRIQA